MKKSWRYCLFLLTALLLLSASVPALAAGDTVIEGLNWGLLLTSPVISTILLVVGITGVVIEIATVGSFGAFGVVGVLSFILYFLGSFWSGSFSSLSVWLLLVGVVLLALELFVVPGFGVCGVLGIMAILAALVMAAPNPLDAVWSLLIALAVSVAIIYFTLKNKKTRKVWGKLVLFQKLDEESGFASADLTLARFNGQQGRSLTTLRPAGSALINGEKVDVVTQGEFIEADQPVEVVLVEGVRVVVRILADSAAQ